MGNNRLALKGNLTKELQVKIDATTMSINRLRAAITTVDKSASEAKAEVQKAVDAVIEQLVARKMDLNNQIDGLCQSQIVSLQESIESAYLRLGNLQSTLSNLNSYDENQLVNLRVPEASRAVELPLGTPLKLQVNTNVITEELKKWLAVSSGESVKANEICSFLSNSHQITKENEMPLSTKASKSSETGKLQPLFPENFLGIVKTNKGSITIIQKEPKDLQIEHWLSDMKIAKSPSNSVDTFEFLSQSETDRISCSEEMKVSSSTNPVSRKASECEDGSSIVCVEMEDVEHDDVSKWLKPKKKRSCSSLSDLSNQAYLHKSKPSGTYQSLDFPCLRSDPISWVQKRKRNYLNISARSQDLCLQVGQSEIIPPTYALPYPFWLKK